MYTDPPLDGNFQVEGVEVILGLPATAEPSVAWVGCGLEDAEAAATELHKRLWRRVSIVWWVDGCRQVWRWQE